MLKKILSTIIVPLIALFAFSSCGGPKTNASFVLPIDNEPAYLDPQIVSDDGARMIMLNCMEGLMTYDESGELIPAAAESFNVSADGLKYTFKLREDGKWRLTKAASAILGEDGAENFDDRVTAKDFVFALRRALEPETKCPFAGLLLNVRNAEKILSGKLSSSKLGVSADGDYSLTIELERPDDDLLSSLASVAALPCNEAYFKATGGRYGLSTAYMIYNGPFYIANWAEGTAITIRRNYMFHDLGEDGIEKEVFPSSVYFSFNSEQATRDRKLRESTYDLAFLTGEQAEEFADGKKVVVRKFDSSTLSMMFNCGDELVSNANLRRSIAFGLDYDVFSSAGEPARSILPGGLTLAGKPIGKKGRSARLSSDKSMAGKCFSAALEELEKTRVNLTLLCDEEDETLARKAIQSLQSAFGVIFGIDVETTDSETLRERIKNGEYQIVLCRLRFSGSGAKAAVSLFSGEKGCCSTFFSSKKLEELISAVYVAGDSKATAGKIAAVEKYLCDRAVIIPLSKGETCFGVSAKSEGIVFAPGGEVALFKQALGS